MPFVTDERSLVNSTVWELDTFCSSDWSTFTLRHPHLDNVLGKDRDSLRDQRTTSETVDPVYWPALLQQLLCCCSSGACVHEVDFQKLAAGTPEQKATQLELLDGFARKAGRQIAKDYVLWPALAGPAFAEVAVADAVANLIRNIWSYAIIFCGHFPDGVHLFGREVIEDETRPGWYLRQLLGSANISGGPAFHVLAGNLSHQIEHHLWPDMPSNRYQKVAPRVKALCARYGLPYNSGPLRRQFARHPQVCLRGPAARTRSVRPRRSTWRRRTSGGEVTRRGRRAGTVRATPAPTWRRAR